MLSSTGITNALLQAFLWPRIWDLWKGANIFIQPFGGSAGLCVELISVIMNATIVYCQEASYLTLTNQDFLQIPFAILPNKLVQGKKKKKAKIKL